MSEFRNPAELLRAVHEAMERLDAQANREKHC
jgi:hypothetical protein